MELKNNKKKYKNALKELREKMQKNIKKRERLIKSLIEKKELLKNNNEILTRPGRGRPRKNKTILPVVSTITPTIEKITEKEEEQLVLIKKEKADLDREVLHETVEGIQEGQS